MSAQSMSRSDWERVKRIAYEAFALPPGDRIAYAREAWADDEILRTETLSLLESMEQAGDRFDTPALALPSSRQAAADALRAAALVEPGTSIGGWTIVRQLGSGGMGTVYLAERTGQEFQQRAAIKSGASLRRSTIPTLPA
jgi:eukaryotic-like serine/threonine-protein kinase